MRESLATIERLAALPRNWDTYGSCPIQEGAIRAAKDLLVIAESLGMKEPCIGPFSGGALELEWNSSSCDLEVTALPDGAIEFVLWGMPGNRELDDADDADDAAIQRAMRTFQNVSEHD